LFIFVEFLTKEASTSNVLPPYDADASIPEKIYSVSAIIPTDELNTIDLEVVWGMGLDEEGNVSLDLLNEELKKWYCVPRTMFYISCLSFD
jgi:hypothetical protein